ncbi:hypothetical protein EDB83DRAFT_2379390 [Lactarius deliciosus]|nr:hypothetical protein EDB83DRAFT_2379390 [Lactarius deliciosus]
MVTAHAHPLCHYLCPLSLFWASMAGGLVSFYGFCMRRGQTCPLLRFSTRSHSLTRANRRADLRRLVARFGNNVNVFNTQGDHFTSSGDPIGIYLASGVGSLIDATCSHKSATAISQHDSVTSRSRSGSVRAEIMLDAIHSSAELWSKDTDIFAPIYI